MATTRRTWGISLTHHRAKLMRRNPTAAESLLWQHLRRSDLGGVRFRRQFPVGHFIADFCCRDRRLIIELDGVHHDEQQSKDEWRSRKLEAWGGYRVMRFRNEDVIENIERTLEDIWDALNIPEEPPGKSSPLLQPDDHRVVKKTDA